MSWRQSYVVATAVVLGATFGTARADAPPLSVAADLGAGVFAGHGSPVPASASLRISPAIALAAGRVRLGATAAALAGNPGLTAAAGPRASLEMFRFARPGADFARLQVGGEALFGRGDARLAGAFVSLELPEVLALTAYAGREPRRRDWRLELAAGVSWRRHRTVPPSGRAPRLSKLTGVYDAVRVASRTKLLAAAATETGVASRLAHLLDGWTEHPPADAAVLARGLDDAQLRLLGTGELGVADIRRSAAASFPGALIDERAFVLTVLQAWRDTLAEARGR